MSVRGSNFEETLMTDTNASVSLIESGDLTDRYLCLRTS